MILSKHSAVGVFHLDLVASSSLHIPMVVLSLSLIIHSNLVDILHMFQVRCLSFFEWMVKRVMISTWWDRVKSFYFVEASVCLSLSLESVTRGACKSSYAHTKWETEWEREIHTAVDTGEIERWFTPTYQVTWSTLSQCHFPASMTHTWCFYLLSASMTHRFFFTWFTLLSDDIMVHTVNMSLCVCVRRIVSTFIRLLSSLSVYR